MHRIFSQRIKLNKKGKGAAPWRRCTSATLSATGSPKLSVLTKGQLYKLQIWAARIYESTTNNRHQPGKKQGVPDQCQKTTIFCQGLSMIEYTFFHLMRASHALQGDHKRENELLGYIQNVCPSQGAHHAPMHLMPVVPRVGAKALGNATGVRMIPKGSQGSYEGGLWTLVISQGFLSTMAENPKVKNISKVLGVQPHTSPSTRHPQFVVNTFHTMPHLCLLAIRRAALLDQVCSSP